MSLARRLPSDVQCQFHHVPQASVPDISSNDSILAHLISSPCSPLSPWPSDLLRGREDSKEPDSYLSELQVLRSDNTISWSRWFQHLEIGHISIEALRTSSSIS